HNLTALPPFLLSLDDPALLHAGGPAARIAVHLNASAALEAGDYIFGDEGPVQADDLRIGAPLHAFPANFGTAGPFVCADADGDGYRSLHDRGRDCDDGNATIPPGALEVPYDGIDQDCSGGDLADADHDGYNAIAAGGNDCDDTRAAVHPGATERPGNGL